MKRDHLISLLALGSAFMMSACSGQPEEAASDQLATTTLTEAESDACAAAGDACASFAESKLREVDYPPAPTIEDLESTLPPGPTFDELDPALPRQSGHRTTSTNTMPRRTGDRDLMNEPHQGYTAEDRAFLAEAGISTEEARAVEIAICEGGGGCY